MRKPVPKTTTSVGLLQRPCSQLLGTTEQAKKDVCVDPYW